MYGLYLCDICVSQLMINKEVYKDTEGSKLVAKVVFINFPATEIVERNRYVKDEIIYVYEFNNGQSFHFSMPCEQLVKKMKRIFLNIGVFRVDDNFPICSAQSRASGCACDLGKIGAESPTPFVFRGPFELVDTGNSFAGYLDLDVTVTNLGRSVVTPYALAPSCFVFKSHHDGPEYKCDTKESSKLPKSTNVLVGDNLAAMGNLVMDNLLDTSPHGNLTRDVAGISPVADHLALGSPSPKLPRPPLVDPTLAARKKKDKKRRKKR
ncbi:hypothetical protein WN51_09844 [Melipona quadrifasciata]|uniref:Uncharacterized protein n=1 Tax=Melipona quadrifasciata TaxID=166423 RepID=A0A0M9A5A0_9HYME|nr:hypothetical protein WN51_09844 [Melipona quadrifasciata]